MLWKKRPDAATTWWMPAMTVAGGGGGMRFGGGKGLSLTAIVLIVGIGWLTGQDPLADPRPIDRPVGAGAPR